MTFTHPTEDLEMTFEAQPETIIMDCYAYSSLHEYGIEPDALYGFDCENSFVMGDIDTSGIERVGQDGEIDARYADHIVAMKDGAVVSTGEPATVITEDLVTDVFGLDARVIPDAESGSLLVVPRWRH